MAKRSPPVSRLAFSDEMADLRRALYGLGASAKDYIEELSLPSIAGHERACAEALSRVRAEPTSRLALARYVAASSALDAAIERRGAAKAFVSKTLAKMETKKCQTNSTGIAEP